MIARALAAAWLAAAFAATAQQPPPPAFAPSNLTPAGVRGLAATCASCHGTDGQAVPGSAFPALAGRPRGAITQLMVQFREGRRAATVMHQIAKGFSEPQLQQLATYFAARP